MSDRAITLGDRYRGCLLGLACGDAVGTTLEFKPRDSYSPLTDMVGGGPFGLQPGQWTDDTSMALCLATSLIECNGFDANDQMQRYLRWWREGYLSSTGRCFDIGNTTLVALERYAHDGNPWAGDDDPMTAGNGSLMRLAPVVLWFHRSSELLERAGESSLTTHAAAEAVDCCRLLARVICNALDGKGKAELLAGAAEATSQPKVQALTKGSYQTKTREQVRGNGYCVESLEAALWCVHYTNDFEQAILTAANLGEDTDTTAAITGQIAGALYGEQGIPRHWRKKLRNGLLIAGLAEELMIGSQSMINRISMGD